MPGASELCGFLDAKQIKRGLITRNVKDAVDLFHQIWWNSALMSQTQLHCLTFAPLTTFYHMK